MSWMTLFLLETVLYLLFALPASFCDVRKLRIPFVYVCVGIFVYLLARVIEYYYFYSFSLAFKNCMLNLLISVVTSVLLYMLVRLFSAGGLGFGDVVFGAYTALYCGFYRNLFATVFAALLGILFYLLLSIIDNFKKKHSEKKGKVRFVHHGIFVIPFVPFITAGAILSKFII